MPFACCETAGGWLTMGPGVSGSGPSTGSSTDLGFRIWGLGFRV